METDRELLEKAARAAGIEIKEIIDTKHGVYAVLTDGTEWSPLYPNAATDCDGDALRLAMKLGICLEYSHDQMYCWTVHRLGEPGKPLETWQETHDRDPYAATRRAIVRAAAAIGGDGND